MHAPSSVTPGPAAYDVKGVFGLTSGAHHYTMKAKLLPKVVRDNAPGPGRYDVPDMALTKYGPHFSMSSKQKPRLVTSGFPGPGSYNVREQSERNKLMISKSMGKTLLEPTQDKVPGPGKYQMGDSYAKSQPYQGVSYSLTGRHPNTIGARNEVPGPGKYNLAYDPEKSGYHYSFRGRYAVTTNDNVPGPGNYHPNVKPCRPNGPSYGFSRRFLQSHSEFANSLLAQDYLLKEVKEPKIPMDLTNYNPRRPNTAR